MASSLTAPEPAPAQAPVSAAQKLVGGASALIFSTGIERSFGFLANVLAARSSNAATFGAYSLALTTANNIASYAGAGIGSTATRFSGQHPQGSSEGRVLTRALALISICSAAAATLILLFGAGPLAQSLLKKAALAPLLRWAALSAGAMILLECMRGFLVGHRRFSNLLVLSLLTGGGMLALLPLAARRGPTPMVWVQFGVALGALAVMVLVLGRAGDSTSEAPGRPAPLGPLVRRVWAFGFIQLAGVVGLNAAGWWVASLVTRSDASLVQMGLFAVANQVRNVVSLVPGLLTQSSWAMLAEEPARGESTPARVMGLCSFLATFASVLLGGVGILILPWVLPAAYGRAYHAAVLPGSLALATAIIHMSGAPAAARLTIVSLRRTGVINAIWSVLVVVSAISWIRPGQWASTSAMAIYLAAHFVSSVLVIASLSRKAELPQGMLPLFAVSTVSAVALAFCARLQAVALEGFVIAGALLTLWICGRLYGLVPHGWRVFPR